MKILLDTHIAIWVHTNTKLLSKKALDIILNPTNTIFYSAVNVWETQVKYLKDSTTFPLSGDRLHELCIQAGMQCLPIKPTHALVLKTLRYNDAAAPRPHKDPFDRMLICQAKAETMLLLTHDELLPHYNEPCVVAV